MREIGSDETGRLEECLIALAAHHNKVSVNFRGHYPKIPVEETIRRFSEDADSGRSYIAVVEDDDKVTGFCKINVDDAVGTIEYLIVLEEYRGRGYGAAFMKWALDRFDSSGVKNIDVKVADGNNAVSLYEKYGFRMNAHILRLCR